MFMRKLLSLFFVVGLLAIGISKASAMSFEEAFNQSGKKPMLVLMYATWADNYENYMNAFKTLEQTYGDNFNFVELNIASEDAKFFNDRYHIYPKLPYVLMYRDGGKVSRYIQRECVLNDSCINARVKSFIQ